MRLRGLGVRVLAGRSCCKSPWPAARMGWYQASADPWLADHLYQVCWSRGSSKTCTAEALRTRIEKHCSSLCLVLVWLYSLRGCWDIFLKGIFQHKFNPWSNTAWHRVRPPLEISSFTTTSLCSFSNFRKDPTITIHCSLSLQPRNRHQKTTHSHK